MASQLEVSQFPNSGTPSLGISSGVLALSQLSTELSPRCKSQTGFRVAGSCRLGISQHRISFLSHPMGHPGQVQGERENQEAFDRVAFFRIPGVSCQGLFSLSRLIFMKDSCNQ